MSFTIFYAYLRYCIITLLSVSLLAATEYKGQIKFGGLPLPGATVTASQGDKRFVAVSGQDGAYSIPDLSDGVWNVEVEMLGFAPLKQDVTIAAGMPAADWDLKMMSLDEMKAIAAPAEKESPAPQMSTGFSTCRAGTCDWLRSSKIRDPSAPSVMISSFERVCSRRIS